MTDAQDRLDVSLGFGIGVSLDGYYGKLGPHYWLFLCLLLIRLLEVLILFLLVFRRLGLLFTFFSLAFLSLSFLAFLSFSVLQGLFHKLV
jgi:hypothetical protein